MRNCCEIDFFIYNFIGYRCNLYLTDVYYASTEEQWHQINMGDVNNDNVISVVDATQIQKYLAGLIEEL